MNINKIFFFLLCMKIISLMYLTIRLHDVDDCIFNISKINKNNETKVYFQYIDSNKCQKNYLDYYPNDKIHLIKYEQYEFGEKFCLTSKDVGGNGGINIDILIDEYTIKTCQDNFWICDNCDWKGENNDYFCNKISNNYRFYKDGDSLYKNGKFYFSLYFQINNQSELNQLGQSYINHDFYTLAQKIFNFTSYNIYEEIELINFNTTETFYITNNASIEVNYSKYYFKLLSKNKFNGTILGLNLSDNEIELQDKDNYNNFKVTDSRGLKYKFSSDDKKNQTIYISLDIEAYNNPSSLSYSQKVSNNTIFQFYISLIYDEFFCLKNENSYDDSTAQITIFNCSYLIENNLDYYHLSQIINRMEINKKIIIKGNNFIINISPINSIFFLISNIYNFTDCENYLRNIYNIIPSEIITLLKIEKNPTNSISQDNEEQYYIYSQNKTFLNISFCRIEDSTTIETSLVNNSTFSNNITNFIYDDKNNIYKIYVEKSKEDLFKNITNIIKIIEIEKKYEIKGDDYNIKISPINSTFSNNETHVDFKLCEDILRYHYNISSSRIITFMQIEIDNKNPDILINKLEYQAYDDNKTLLNLSLCDKNIKIIHSIKSSASFDLISASLFKELGIDIFNINDSFFTDVCHSYSDDENDLTLKDRIKAIFINISLCEKGCSYDEIDLQNMTVTCDCKVKDNVNFDEINVNLLPYISKNANFQIIKCYNLVFSLKGKLLNIGFWIFLVLNIFHIPIIFLYFYKGIKPIYKYIIEEMKKYGYIKNIKKYKSKNKNTKNKKDKIGEDSLNRKFINDSNLNNKKKSNKQINKIKIIKKNNNTNKKQKKEIHLIKKSKNKSKNNLRKINILSTKDNINNKKIYKKKETKTKSIKGKENKIFNFTIINITLDDKKRTYSPQNSYQILDNYTFQEAIKYDLRSICVIYYIFLLSKQPIFHALLFKSPLELFYLRLCLLIFIYSSDLALNSFFYLDDKISEKFHYAKSIFLFAFSNNITVIFLSILVGFIFMIFFKNLSNSTKEIRDLFRNEEEKLIKNKKYIVTENKKKEIINKINKILKKLKIKIFILLLIEFLLMLFFWYYVTAFCHVYNSTQYSWLFDSFLSILSRTVIDFLFPLLLAKLYRISVESNVYCLYKIILFFYWFC